MTRLEIISVEEKTAKSGKPYWRVKCSDGNYYSVFARIVAGLYDLEIKEGIIKSAKSVGESPKHQPVPESDRNRSFAVSYAKDLTAIIIGKPSTEITIAEIEDIWTRLTAHAMWLLTVDADQIGGKAQMLEHNPEHDPF